LGLALALQAIPRTHDAFEPMLRSFQNHAAALAGHQDGEGMWRQVIDKNGAYRELSATAMIGRALLIGVRAGWLDAQYQERVESAWEAVKARVSTDGVLLDVCESTGKQRSLNDYLQRRAVFDKDPRGGAMALMFATEMAGLQ
jgi:rhamnogalacturonyl hydrolase YesR